MKVTSVETRPTIFVLVSWKMNCCTYEWRYDPGGQCVHISLLLFQTQYGILFLLTQNFLLNWKAFHFLRENKRQWFVNDETAAKNVYFLQTWGNSSDSIFVTDERSRCVRLHVYRSWLSQADLRRWVRRFRHSYLCGSERIRIYSV
jgi:hypothetical protein